MNKMGITQNRVAVTTKV